MNDLFNAPLKKGTKKKVKEKEKKMEKVDTKEKVAEKAVPDFTEADLAEFKAWKESRQEIKIIANAQKDDKLYRMWQEDSKLVRGIFRCHEPKGGQVMFYYRKYKWDDIKKYEFKDGEVYEIPKGVAKHINQNCHYYIHSNILDANGAPALDKQNKKVDRMMFESTEFADL